MPNEMSLSNLTSILPDQDTIQARIAEIQAERKAEEQKLREQHGDKWRGEVDRRFQEDAEKECRKRINSFIYHTGKYPIDGFTKMDVEKPHIDAFEARLYEVYGDQYDELKANRSKNDPRVAELLIQEAIRNNSGDELSDELEAEYARRTGGA